MIVYGKLDLLQEAENLFRSLWNFGIIPNVVTFNTMINVYGEAEMVNWIL
jgi:pentatricopeptide repeat protein